LVAGGIDFDLNHAADLAVIIGALVLGVGYAAGQWRRGKNDQAAAALGLASDELELSSKARDRQAAELKDAGERIAKLEAIVEQLQRENDALRRLVMLETVPPALTAALEESGRLMLGSGERMHIETRAAIKRELEETEQRITALLERGN
jgi:outer membrane murein-binding lipoprotein Lpp